VKKNLGIFSQKYIDNLRKDKVQTFHEGMEPFDAKFPDVILNLH
jgi:hypothetical protein